MNKMVIETNKISLNGVWDLTHTPFGCGMIDSISFEESITASVPGDVHYDYVKAGKIADPMYGENAKDCRWMEEMEFWYRKKFSYETKEKQVRTTLCFEGLDLYSEIWLNGKKLGVHENAFTKAEFDISSILLSGENELIVKIDEGVLHYKDKPMEKMGLMWNADQPYRVWMRKPQYVYSWDWTIWLPSCGIWKEVYLTEHSNAQIKDVIIKNDLNSGSLRTVGQSSVETVLLEIDIPVRFLGEEAGNLEIELLIQEDTRFSDGNIIFQDKKEVIKNELNTDKKLNERTTHVKFALRLEEVKLWYTNLWGNPYLYDLTVLLKKDGNIVLDSQQVKYGFRTIEIQENAVSETETGFTFYLNGNPLFCNGANHVPLECLPGQVTSEKMNEYLTKFKECGMNMIRVWGGGYYESDEFLNFCSREGILVWHDFMFACGFHPDHDAEFMKIIEEEAAEQLHRMKNQACLAGWSGNNEIQEMYISIKQNHSDLKWYGGRIFEELLPELVKRISPHQIYRESSPFGEKEDPAGFTKGDQHIWHFTHRPAYEHYMDLWRFSDFNIKFLSEFGILGGMNPSTFKTYLTKDCTIDSKEWSFHTNNSDSHHLMDRMLRTYFTESEQDSVEMILYKSQLLQAELTRHIYDEFQRRKFICSGLLFWTFGDAFPMNNWALLNYDLSPRPVYHYLKRSIEPVKLCFKGYEVQNFEGMKEYGQYFENTPEKIEIWGMNDLLRDQMYSVRYHIVHNTGKVMKLGAWKGVFPANSSRKLFEVDLDRIFNKDKEGSVAPEETFLIAEIYDGDKKLHENHYLFAPYGKMKLLPATLRYGIKQQPDGTALLRLSTNKVIWMLHMDSEQKIQFSDNAFFMRPTVKKDIVIKTDSFHIEDLKFYSLEAISITEDKTIFDISE